MALVLLSLHLMIAIVLVGVVLLQRSEGGGLGMGSSGGGGFMTGRGTANLLTRVTAGLAALFFVTSISLTLLAKHNSKASSPLDLPALKQLPPIGAPATPGSPAPGTPSTPAAPEKGAAAPANAPATPAPAAKQLDPVRNADQISGAPLAIYGQTKRCKQRGRSRRRTPFMSGGW